MDKKDFSCLLDSGAIIIEFNDRSFITGYHSDEIVGENWFDIFIPDADMVEILEVFSGVFNGKRPHWFYDNTIVYKDGTKKMIHFNNNIIKDHLGKPEYLFFTAEEKP